MGRPARHEIEKFANDAFAVARDRILKEHAAKNRQVLAQVRMTRNRGGHLPALIGSGAECVRELILALADAYVEAFTLHRTPSDMRAETTLKTEAQRIAAGTISTIRGELRLRSVRLRIAEEGRGIPWHLQIETAMNTALKEGVLRLKQQRINFRDSGRALQRADHTAIDSGRIDTQGPARDPHSASPPDAAPQFAVIRPWSGSGDQPPTPQFPRLETLDGFVVRWMYHPAKPAVMVFSAKQIAELGPEWSDQYVHQDYPRVKYHWNRPSITVNNAEDEKSRGSGWANTPAAFEPYKGARLGRTDEHDPCKWLDQWSVPGLSSDHRTKIKAQLLRADAIFERSPEPDSGLVAAMRQAFNGIAQVLFDSETLTEDLLRTDIPLLVWDSAIAAEWYRPASESPRDIFPEQLGHYWVWRDEGKDWNGLFRAETAEWQARLLEAPRSSQAVSDPTSPAAPEQPLRAVKKRGRPTRFTEDQLSRAHAMKQGGQNNNAIAKLLYATLTPTEAQRRSVPTILNHHFGPKK